MQLARVTDRSPLLLPLRPTRNAQAHSVVPYTLVRIRPTVLHVLINNRVWCLIRSDVPITDVINYCNKDSTACPYQVLVSLADGNVWMVLLPAHVQSQASTKLLREILLERSSNESNDGVTQWFCQVPGVQSIAHLVADWTSFTFMRSVITPSTLIMSTRGSSESKLRRYQSLELDDLEGEQSTCSLILNSQDLRHYKLLMSLFPDAAQIVGVIAILQGDLDGSVRFSLVCYPCKEGHVTKATVLRSGTLAQLGQPVQMIVPFTSADPCTASSEENTATRPLLVFDALLVLGARGRIGAIHVPNSCWNDTFPVLLTKLELGHVVQSLVFVASMSVFVFCSSGSAFVFRGKDVIRKAQSGESEAQYGSRIDAEQLPFQPGILRLAMHDCTHAVSILFASGRLATITEISLCAKVSNVLLPEQHGHDKKLPPVEEPISDFQIRNLLHRIAHTSTESTALRTQSKQIDCQLKTLHSALELLRLIETQGVNSVVTCEIRASIVTTGTYLDLQTIRLSCYISFVSPNAILSLDEWWLCIYVHTCKPVVETHSFPLNAVLTRGEQIIMLDPETFALHDQESLRVSCSIVFCPTGNGLPEKKGSKVNGIEFNSMSQESLLSFAIPLLQDQRFLFAQLSRPVEEETRASEVIIQSAFCPDHDSLVLVGRKGNNVSSSPRWSGVQWWDALSDYAKRSASFATLWAKIAPPDINLVTPFPPSRFVVSISSFFDAEGEEVDHEEDDLEKIRNEKMVSFLCHLLAIYSDEVPRLRRSCRTQNGKLWTTLQTVSENSVLLRLSPSEVHQRSLDISIQCSDSADLSAMRALILETINKRSDETVRGSSKVGLSEELVLKMSEMLEPIAALDNLLGELKQKTANSIVDPQSSICTDEVLHALSQLAHLETQTLTIYWKTRLLLNSASM